MGHCLSSLVFFSDNSIKRAMNIITFFVQINLRYKEQLIISYCKFTLMILLNAVSELKIVMRLYGSYFQIFRIVKNAIPMLYAYFHGYANITANVILASLEMDFIVNQQVVHLQFIVMNEVFFRYLNYSTSHLVFIFPLGIILLP